MVRVDPVLRLAAAIALAALPAAAALASAGSPPARGTKPVRTLLEGRQAGVVRQGWDLSCGAAALGTLLRFHLGDPVSEPEIVQAILRDSDPERIRARGGFSLLDLKRAAEARGYDARGYGKLDLDGLVRLAPAIVPTTLGREDHFVVFQGVDGDRALLADPAFGNRTVPLHRFERLWPQRVAFVVRRPGGEPDGDTAPARAPVVPAPLVRQAIGGLR